MKVSADMDARNQPEPTWGVGGMDFGRMYVDPQQPSCGYGEVAVASQSISVREDAPFRAGRYVILHHVGHGAMGNVYVAYDPDLDRKVAVKVLRDSSRPIPASLAREAQAMAKLVHTNVVAVFDVGTCDRGVFVAMEFVEGVTLRTWLRQQDRDWRTVIAVFEQAGRGLAAAHNAGVIHHDFKPDNVLVSAEGHVKVADFGLARVAASTSAAISGELGSPSHESAVTRNHATVAAPSGSASGSAVSTALGNRGPVGTLAYMAPERHLQHPDDARSDQFSFCVALYEALYRHRPFTGDDIASLRHAVLHNPPAEPPRAIAVPPRLAAVVRRGLARDPNDRFPSMDALLAAMAEPPASSLRWPLVASVGLGSAMVVMLAQGGEGPCQATTDAATTRWHAASQALRQRFPAVSDTLQTLDQAQQAWATRRSDSCEAGAQGLAATDLRLVREACLDRHLITLEVALDQATRADTAEEAEYLLAATDLHDTCDDLRTLSAVAPPAPDIAPAVATARKNLATIAGLEVAGGYTTALANLVALRQSADPLGYAPLQAELAYQQARLEHYSGDTASAQDTLARVVDLAEAHRHDRLAADAWGFLAETAVLSPTARATDIQAFARRAAAATARLHSADAWWTAGDPQRIAGILPTSTTVDPVDQVDPQRVHPELLRGLLALHAEEFADAAEIFRAALQMQDLHPRMRAKLQLNLAAALQHIRDENTALAAWDAGVAAALAATWSWHPEHALARLRRAEFLQWKGRYAAARADFAAAAQVFAADPGSHTAAMRSAQLGLAIADTLALNIRSAQAALAALGALDGASATDPMIAGLAFEVHLVAGNYVQAQAAAARELELVQPSGDELAIGRAEVRVAEAAMYLGHYSDAAAALAAAEPRFTAAGSEGDDDMAYALRVRGALAARRGDNAAAIAAWTTALDHWQREPCDCRSAAEASLGLAILQATTDPASARAATAAADQFFGPLGNDAAKHRNNVATWVATVEINP